MKTCFLIGIMKLSYYSRVSVEKNCSLTAYWSGSGLFSEKTGETICYGKKEGCATYELSSALSGLEAKVPV